MDKIIYCNDLIALKAQLKSDGFYDEESGLYTTDYALTPIKKNGNTSLSLVRGLSLDLNVYTMLEDLGDYKSIIKKTNKAKLDKYKSVYPYDVPVKYVDENGDTQTYTLPFKIGEFA